MNLPLTYILGRVILLQSGTRSSTPNSKAGCQACRMRPVRNVSLRPSLITLIRAQRGITPRREPENWLRLLNHCMSGVKNAGGNSGSDSLIA